MAKRSASKPQESAAREPARQPDLLENLESSEAAVVLREMLAAHPELRSEAQAIARGVLGEVSFLSIAEEVEDSLRQLDYDDLNGRAGGHSWGYTEPSEAAEELLQEAIEPQVSELKRHLALGLKKEALAICQGLILGFYRVRSGEGGDVLGWAPDFADQAASNVLKQWRAAGGPSLPPDFVAQHVPEWPWVAHSDSGR
jgi:hypothetical protein